MEAGFIYLMICTILTKLQSFMEKKLEWKQPSETKIKAETVTEG